MSNQNDKDLLVKFEAQILEGLDESSAIDFFAKLSLDEYSRLIELFSKSDETMLPPDIRTRMVGIFQKLRKAKEAALSRA